MNTNRLFFSSLQKDIVQINTTVHCLSKEPKALFLHRNFFHHHVSIEVPPSNYLDWIKFPQNKYPINNKSNFNHKLSKLTPALLSILDLTSLFTKLESKLVSHPRLALPACHGENIWYMYRFMKL